MVATADILLEGLTFPECPRWHEGALWFSDMHANRIIRMTPDGHAETMVDDARQPAGIGWLPNGDLVYNRMVERTLVRLAGDGGESIVADLSMLEAVQINDMVVSAEGHAFIGGFGFDINKGDQFVASNILMVDLSAGGRAPSEESSRRPPVVAAADMRFPNGMVITPDGRTFIAAETVGRCLTAFDIADDGALTNRREWAALSVFPDGICLDAEGVIWVASPLTGECLRVKQGGKVTHTVKSHAKGVYACMLGGADGRTLYLCTATTTGPELAQHVSTGWIEAVGVAVPHAGLP
jgi:sugar lactone lactonase YvrE